MGQWETERGHGSDAMADILSEGLKKIGELPWKPTLLDLADAIEFVTRGALTVEINPSAPRLGRPKTMSVRDLRNTGLFKTIPNRGQIHGMMPAWTTRQAPPRFHTGRGTRPNGIKGDYSA